MTWSLQDLNDLKIERFDIWFYDFAYHFTLSVVLTFVPTYGCRQFYRQQCIHWSNTKYPTSGDASISQLRTFWARLSWYTHIQPYSLLSHRSWTLLTYRYAHVNPHTPWLPRWNWTYTFSSSSLPSFHHTVCVFLCSLTQRLSFKFLLCEKVDTNLVSHKLISGLV